MPGRGDTVGLPQLSAALDRLGRQLMDSGYLRADAAIDTFRDEAGVHARIVARPGDRTRVGSWRVTAGDTVPHVVVRGLPRRGTPLTRPVSARATAAVLAAWQEAGYPFASVSQSIVDSAGFATADLAVDGGESVYLSFIDFAGAPALPVRGLARRARFRAGPYSRSAVAAWTRNLAREEVLAVDSQALVRRDSSYGVVFWLGQRPANRASAVVGYAPASRQWTGSAELAFLSLFETGRRLEASWQSAYGRTEYSVGYTEPWLLGTGIDLSASAGQRSVDTSSSQLRLAASAAMPVAAASAVTLDAGLDRHVDVVRRQKSSTTWGGTGFVWQTLDNAANPARGVRLGVSTRVGSRVLDSLSGTVTPQGPGRASVIGTAGADFESVVTVRGPVVWYTGLAGQTIYSPGGLLPGERLNIGGRGSVRGYADDEFASAAVAWWNGELRYVLGRYSHAALFLDAGAYADGGWHAIAGYGAGVRLATGAGLVGLDYGIAVGESPLRGKVHLSFGAVF